VGTLRTIRKDLDSRNLGGWEIVVVDDGSTDGSADLVNGLDPRIRVIRFPANRGKGAAVRAGMLAACGRWRLMTDADLATPIEEIGRLISAMKAGADVVIGRRTGPRSRVRTPQPWYRRTMGKMFNLFMRLLFNLNYQDTQCGFKLFTARAAGEIFPRCRVNRFAFDLECLLLARQLGFRVAERYVVWDHVERSRVRLIADSASMLLSLVRLRLGIH